MAATTLCKPGNVVVDTNRKLVLWLVLNWTCVPSQNKISHGTQHSSATGSAQRRQAKYLANLDAILLAMIGLCL